MFKFTKEEEAIVDEIVGSYAPADIEEFADLLSARIDAIAVLIEKTKSKEVRAFFFDQFLKEAKSNPK